MICVHLPARGNTPHGLFSPIPNHGVICGNPACRTMLSPAMIAYALGARTVRGNSTSSRTPPLGAALPRHSGLRTRQQRARQRIPGILHLAKRKCWRSAAGDPQTLAAPVANIAGNAFCTRSKKCEVSKNDTRAAGAGGSNYADRWLESVWITIRPASHLIRVSAQNAAIAPSAHERFCGGQDGHGKPPRIARSESDKPKSTDWPSGLFILVSFLDYPRRGIRYCFTSASQLSTTVTGLVSPSTC